MMGNRLAELHPEISKNFLTTYADTKKRAENNDSKAKEILKYLDRVVIVSAPKKVLDLGCGPVPVNLQYLHEAGYDARGVEPVKKYVETGNEFLNSSGVVIEGTCEAIPFPDEVFDIIICTQVMEHVDSPEKSLNEMFRVLKPGGVVYISSENRQRFSISGHNNEFNVRFYNWFPRGVKEGYINKHLNRSPHLANYTPLPAVHWYTYPELCRLGRLAGFGKFYSLVEVMTPDEFGNNFLIRSVIKLVKRNMWLRWLFLTQKGGSKIIMYKRK